jgi:hypothetical protein
MTNSTTPAQPPAAIAALGDLAGQLLANPLTAGLVHGGTWSASMSLDPYVMVIRQVDADDPQAVLDAVAALVGGTFVAGHSLGDGQIWHELEMTWKGVRLELKLAAPGMSAEDALRDRVAELEQQLAATQQPEPPASDPVVDFAASVAAGHMSLPDWGPTPAAAVTKVETDGAV